jgi:hypothetical protein
VAERITGVAYVVFSECSRGPVKKELILDKTDSQPSLRDWSRYTLIVDTFSARDFRIGRSKKAKLGETGPK